MNRIIEHTKIIKNLIIKPEEIVNLAETCHVFWKRELTAAEKKWNETKLPELIKKIDQHNKDVLKKKSTYSFNTYLAIGEKDKEAVIEKEHDFFVNTSEQVYPFYSTFKVSIKNETIEEITPNFLKDLELENIESIYIKTQSSKKERSVNIKIYNENYSNKRIEYSIRGDSEWVITQEKKIEEILNKIQKPKKITKCKILISILITTLTCVSVGKIIFKFNIKNLNILLGSSSPIIFLILFFLYSSLVNRILPNFAITKEYEPFKKNKAFLFIKFLFLTIISPWVIDMSKKVVELLK